MALMNQSKLSKQDILYLILTTSFCVIVIVSNAISAKIWSPPLFSWLTLSAGLITYPITFLISDLVTELFGPARSRFMVYLGFGMAFTAYLLIECALRLPPSDPINQSHFSTVFGLNGIIVLSSLIAYGVSQITDIQLYALFKRMTHGKHLWFRNNGSTLISQFIDTTIVCTGFFYFGFGFPFLDVIPLILAAYFYKALWSIANTPLFYLGVALAKKYINKKEETLSSPSLPVSEAIST
jgi:queuosine precursor transporter